MSCNCMNLSATVPAPKMQQIFLGVQGKCIVRASPGNASAKLFNSQVSTGDYQPI